MSFLKNLLGQREPSRKQQRAALEELRMNDPTQFRLDMTQAGHDMREAEQLYGAHDQRTLAAKTRWHLFAEVDNPAFRNR